MLKQKRLTKLPKKFTGVVAIKLIACIFLHSPGLLSSRGAIQSMYYLSAIQINTTRTPLRLWIWIKTLFQWVHAVFSEMRQNNFLVLIDIHSKQVKVKCMTQVQNYFYFLWSTLENNFWHQAQFDPWQFQDFMWKSGIKHLAFKSVLIWQINRWNIELLRIIS